MIAGMLLFLTGAFFRSQVLQHQKYALQAETNRLREIPLPAPRGVIYDRNHKIIADNVIGYSVSLLAPKEDSLRAAGVAVEVRHDAECIRMMREFIETHPDLWNEDIGR